MYQQITMSFEPITRPTKRDFRETSALAKESIEESKEETFNKILKALRESPDGLTSEELSFKANISYASAHKRLADLVIIKKLVYNTGETRKNKSGRKSMVRKIVDNGEKERTF